MQWEQFVEQFIEFLIIAESTSPKVQDGCQDIFNVSWIDAIYSLNVELSHDFFGKPEEDQNEEIIVAILLSLLSQGLKLSENFNKSTPEWYFQIEA